MASETILEPEWPIIDPHHHLWEWPDAFLQALPHPQHGFMEMLRHKQRYLLHELLADLGSGHNIRATVFIETYAMYRADGPEELRSTGETEFANGIAAMSASGFYGAPRVAAGIIGNVDLRLGARTEAALHAHLQAGGGRFRGVRQSIAHDDDANVLGPLSAMIDAGLYRDATFRTGVRVLQRLGLSLDTWMMEPQLPELVDLARACPGAAIIMDHVGTPVGIGTYKGQREARFDTWRRNIKAVAACPNVVAKLGGLGMPFAGFPWSCDRRPASSGELARAWAPYIEACIEAFGPTRCMFESNFPVDSFSCDYGMLWNAFKRIVANYSADEKNALFFDTAARVYRLDVER